jgi:hypothetical protein
VPREAHAPARDRPRRRCGGDSDALRFRLAATRTPPGRAGPAGHARARRATPLRRRAGALGARSGREPAPGARERGWGVGPGPGAGRIDRAGRDGLGSGRTRTGPGFRVECRHRDRRRCGGARRLGRPRRATGPGPSAAPSRAGSRFSSESGRNAVAERAGGGGAAPAVLAAAACQCDLRHHLRSRWLGSECQCEECMGWPTRMLRTGTAGGGMVVCRVRMGALAAQMHASAVPRTKGGGLDTFGADKTLLPGSPPQYP